LIGGTPRRFIVPGAEKRPEQFGPMILAPPSVAVRRISASIFFPSAPVSPRPAVMITIPLACIFTLSDTAWGMSFGATTTMTRSTDSPMSRIEG
jgi:hypothetical protein